MKWLTLVLFFISSSNSFALSCITTNDGKPLTKSMKGFNLDQFKSEIQNLSSNVNDDVGSLCRVHLSLNYNDRKMNFKFTEHLKRNSSKDQNIRIDTYVAGNEPGNIDVTHILQYACSSDQCDIHFIDQHIQWFFNFDYQQLLATLGSLIFTNGTGSGNCFDQGGVLKECNSSQCVANIKINNDAPQVTRQYCAVKQKVKKPGLYFTGTFDTTLTFIKNTFIYYCNYDQCNNEKDSQNVTKLFDEIYDIDSVIAMFTYKNQSTAPNQDNTTNVMQPSTSSGIQQETNSFQSTTITDPPAIGTTTIINPTTIPIKSSTPVETKSSTPVGTKSSTPIGTTSSTSVGTTSSTPTQTNAGNHGPNTNGIIYTTLIIFMSYLFLFRHE